MTPGLVVRASLAADQVVTASVTPVTITGFTLPIVAGQKYHFRASVPFSVGASGGCRFFINGPAAPTSFVNAEIVFDTDTPAVISSVVTAPTAFANALAVAGAHLYQAEGEFVASAAGNVVLQFACNSAAGAITALAGAYFEIVKM